ncbi:MAG: CopY/TcrY family copper transport repressor [Lactobacillus sp.]|jgi:CopY/TcrY family copper transport repressor|nr:CopY/TcrY family copper transport repressor [Lactobacillus sp.]
MKNSVSAAEWVPLRVIWTLKQAHTNKIIAYTQAQTAWSDSTIKTLLRRLEQKGFISSHRDGRKLVYEPVKNEQATMTVAAEDQLSSMCQMHRGQVILQLIKDNEISKQDLLALQAEIAKKLPAAPDQVACDCLKSKGDQHEC